MVDAKKETFEFVMLDAYPVLFTSARIDRKTVPKRIYSVMTCGMMMTVRALRVK